MYMWYYNIETCFPKHAGKYSVEFSVRWVIYRRVLSMLGNKQWSMKWLKYGLNIKYINPMRGTLNASETICESDEHYIRLSYTHVINYALKDSYKNVNAQLGHS